MKIEKLKLFTALLLLLPLLVAMLGAGCEKEDEQILEISPESERAVIQKEVDGIEFKFCLLNEAGEASTIFNEGENFIFHFSFKNLKDDTIVVTTEFMYDDFFKIYQVSSNNLIDMGKPWTGIWCEYSLAPQGIELKPTIEKQLNCPWILTENNVPDYPLCMSESKDYLDAGKYSTSFNLNFHYTIASKKNIIDNVIFKINFEIH